MANLNLYIFIVYLVQPSDAILKFVQIWFRHGERLPTHYLHFPGEDFNNLDYLKLAYPGELTNRGIKEEYQLGQILKAYYGEHFGNIYRPIEFHVYTGRDNRTSTSAQAMFAGFFPPNEQQVWDPSLKWFPVAQETDSTLDLVSLGALENCPTYGPIFENSKEYKEAFKKLEEQDKELISLIRHKTGTRILNLREYNYAIDSLKIRVVIKNDLFPLPEWAKGYERQILNASYLIHNSVVVLQNETIGNYHMELVMSYFETFLQKNNTKGVFISGHDTNIMTIWEAFQLIGRPADIPFFGAHLAIELHEENSELFLKFFLSMGFNQTRTELTPKLCQNRKCNWQIIQDLSSRRKSRSDWKRECRGEEQFNKPISTITGSIIVILSILLLSTIVLGFTTFSYKRQLNNFRDPERIRLLE